MIILDTDVLSLLQLGEGSDARVLRQRLAGPPEHNAVFVSIITFEEQMRGWLDWIAKSKTMDHQVHRYRKLHDFLEDYKTRLVLDFDQAAAHLFLDLKKEKIRIGTMDLKIAAIAKSHRATLVSRNLADYRQVPGLQVEDWTQPT